MIYVRAGGWSDADDKQRETAASGKVLNSICLIQMQFQEKMEMDEWAIRDIILQVMKIDDSMSKVTETLMSIMKNNSR